MKSSAELDVMILRRNGFGEDACQKNIRSLSVVGKIERPARSEAVSPLSNNVISRISECGSRRENFRIVDTSILFQTCVTD